MIEAISNPTGAFVDALRKAVKKPAVKSSPNYVQFPEDQRATAEQINLKGMTLAKAVYDYVGQVQVGPLGNNYSAVTLTYGAWKKCRNLLGRQCKKLRLLEPSFYSQPLRWASEGGGARYIYTEEEAKRCVRDVMRQTVKETHHGRPAEPVFHRVRYYISCEEPETWPSFSADLEPVF